MTMKKSFEKMARVAKKNGIALEKIIPTVEPFRTIVETEYNRYQPRK